MRTGIGWVLLGGLLGAPLRYAVALALPVAPGCWPTATLVVNVAGALLLGLLLGTLGDGPDTPTRRRIRLLLGTGLLGALTTYSTLALELDLLERAHRPALALGYAAASLAGGLSAVAAGGALGRRLGAAA